MTFRFVTFADSRGGYDILAAISNSAVALNPLFAVFPGDLCNSFDVNCINNTWKPVMNGNSGNGLLDRSFVSHGNHDAGTLSTWQGLWDFARVANIIGVTNYTEETHNATYSFDYENSHFVVIDLPGGGVNTLSPLIGVPSLSAAQVSWLDSDLTDAEARTEIQNIFLLDQANQKDEFYNCYAYLHCDYRIHGHLLRITIRIPITIPTKPHAKK